MRQPKNEKLGFLTKENAYKILEKFQEIDTDTPDPKIMYKLTVLLLFTGARFSEVASLTWNDIDLDNKLIYFKATKNGNQRKISMTPLVEKVIKSLSKEHHLLFFTSKNNQYKQMPKKWQQIVDEVLGNNTVKINTNDKESLTQEEIDLINNQKKYRITIHSLRHTHASWMAMSGKFSLLEIKEQLGHKTLQMTERYSHLMESDRHKKMNELFGGF